jgi:hypothetical protein
MKNPLIKSWTDGDVALLRKLAQEGATLMRASAALGRPNNSIRKKARQLNLEMPGVRAVKAKLRASGAIEPGRTRSNGMKPPNI